MKIPEIADLSKTAWADRAPEPEEEQQEYPPDHLFSVTIGVKSLLKFLTTNLTNATTIACEPCAELIAVI